MTQLRIYNQPEQPLLELESSLSMEIAELLEDAGIPYQKIQIDHGLANQTGLLKDLQQMVDRDFPAYRLGYCKIVKVEESYPNFDRIRLMYLSEHTLDQDEAYLILAGTCQVNFHLEAKVIQLECEKGDFVIIPAHFHHWIDFGLGGQFVAIKCSAQEEMPPISFTGKNISDRFPRLGLT